jgi:hypothetical protein
MEHTPVRSQEGRGSLIALGDFVDCIRGGGDGYGSNFPCGCTAYVLVRMYLKWYDYLICN